MGEENFQMRLLSMSVTMFALVCATRLNLTRCIGLFKAVVDILIWSHGSGTSVWQELGKASSQRIVFPMFHFLRDFTTNSILVSAFRLVRSERASIRVEFGMKDRCQPKFCLHSTNDFTISSSGLTTLNVVVKKPLPHN